MTPKRNYNRWPGALTAYRDESSGPDGCWLWTKRIMPNGYGVVNTPGGVQYAHRAVYAHEVGPIPDGLVIDHLCRVRACVNPQHLRAVTQGENLAAGERGYALTGRCRSGRHDVTDPSSWYVDHRGARECVGCRKLRGRSIR